MAKNVSVKDLEGVVAQHEEFKNAYFWTPPKHASERRKMEKQNSRVLEFDYNGTEYMIDQDVSVSCANVYYTLAVWVGGVKKDIRAVKSLIKSIKASGNKTTRTKI